MMKFGSRPARKAGRGESDHRNIMTISYQFNVATASFAGFPKLLARWKGSVYKLVFKEVLVYASLYIIISFVYRIALTEPQRRTFEQVCLHMEISVNFIPLTFVLGFYVSFVVGRWWDQWNSYPWPDRLCFLIILYISGTDERSRLIRRTLVRYLNASSVLLTRSVSIVAKKRFPTFNHLVEAGLLTKEEFTYFEDLNIQYAKYWVPLVWFTKLVDQAKNESLFKDPSGGMKQIMDELMNFRDKQAKIWAFDYVSVPIVYTQVVTLATYMYFVGCLFSRQFLDPAQKYENYVADIYIPIFTLLQFFFYVGWLKVAESLINPWGEDDDDFEVNWIIDRNMQVSYAMVDDMSNQNPGLEKDRYWDEHDVQLPYTQAAMEAKKKPNLDHLGSTMNLSVPPSGRPMRRPSAPDVALGSSIDLVLRKGNRKISREEDLYAYLPRNPSQNSFQEISITVPADPYQGQRPTTSQPEVQIMKDENGYLTPGFPTYTESQPFGPEIAQKRIRKISSPARTRFYSPDKEILAKFNSRLGTITDSHDEETEHAEILRSPQSAPGGSQSQRSLGEMSPGVGFQQGQQTAGTSTEPLLKPENHDDDDDDDDVITGGANHVVA
ncbi:Bestrophin-3 [Hypsibius exemplaris]|uniref:Bestrophin homolog n=1 Tax=Hypsibius exemplaris TaxID=2072580 RepID=A0A1W0WAD9_HYPEX|nr:Bestrophin-3 [Hypsibius exemplaris]